MKFSRLLLCLATVAMLLSSPPADAGDKKARILFVTQSKGFTHGSVRRKGDLAPAEVAMTQLGQQTELFEIHCTQNAAADFTKENLQNYDIVMFYTTGNLGIDEAAWEYFFGTWLKQKGHGFLGFHSATDTYKDYEPYWDFIGGTFNGHPWNSGSNVTITVHDPAHPAMKAFGKEFEFKDEIYRYKNWQPEKVRVLMSLNMGKSARKEPYHVPVSWVKQWGEGRMFYNNLGHNEATWRDKRFLDSTEAAIRWVLGKVDGDATPNPKVSAAQEDKAKADTEAAKK